MPFESLGDAVFFLITETKLDGGISLLLLVFHLKNAIATGLNHGDRADATLRVIDAGHTDFFSEKSDAHSACKSQEVRS